MPSTPSGPTGPQNSAEEADVAAAAAVDSATGVDVEASPPRDGLPGRLGRNVGVSYAAVAVSSISALVMTPLLLKYLGPEAFGLWVLATSTMAYIELVDMGFGGAATKMIAEDANRRPERVLRSLNSNFFALSALAPLALVLGATVGWFSPTLFEVPADLESTAQLTITLLAVSLAASIPLDVIGGALAGHQRYDLLGLSNLTLTLISTVAGVTVAALGGGVVGVAIAFMTTSLSVHLLRWRLLGRLVPGLRLSPRLVERRSLRLATGMSGWFLLRQVSDILINKSDLIVIGVLLGVREVAVYAIGLKLTQLGRHAMVPLSQVFFPHASSLSVSEDKGRLSLLMTDGTRVSMLVAMPIMLVLTLLAEPTVDAWVGDGYDDAATVLVILAVGRVLSSVTDTSRWLLAGAGWIKVTALVGAAEALTNLGLSVWLAGELGVVGVAVGTAVAVACIGLPATLVLASRRVGVTLRHLARVTFLPHVVPTAVVAGFLLLVPQVLPTGVLTVVVAAGLAFVGYVAIYLALSATPTERERAASLGRKARRRVSR